MSGAKSRLQRFAAHFIPGQAAEEYSHRYNFHTLSPTQFLPRAAEIEPDVRCQLLSFFCHRFLYFTAGVQLMRFHCMTMVLRRLKP